MQNNGSKNTILHDTYNTTSISKLDAISRSAWAPNIKVFRLTWDEEAGQDVVWYRDATRSIIPDLVIILYTSSILTRFTNCKTFEITGVEYDYDGMFPPMPDKLGSSDLLGIGLILIAESRLLLQTLCLKSGSETGSGSSVVKTRVHVDQILRPGFQRAVSELKKLSLRPSFCDTACGWTGKLVSQARHVEELDWKVPEEEACSLVALDLCNVRIMSLESMKTTTRKLKEFPLACRPYLRSLQLFCVKLDGIWDNWTSIFRCLLDFEQLESIISCFLLTEAVRVPLCFFEQLQERMEELVRTADGVVELRFKNIRKYGSVGGLLA